MNTIASCVINAIRDYRLGRLIRVNGVSVMRIKESQLEWSACDSAMEFDFWHNGKWAVGATPFEAASNVSHTDPM